MNLEDITLKRTLGEGGMASVWEAHHGRLACDVAIKFLSPSYRGVPGAHQRLAREAKLTASVHSDNVVRVLDSKERTQNPYIVLEKVEGEDLAVRLARLGVLTVIEARLMVSQVGDALAAAEHVGVVHCDVKAQNVVVSGVESQLHVTLIDFGIAQHVDQAASDDSEVSCGTPHAMSPEQMLDPHHPAHQWDVWALAVLAYRSITGRMPFEGGGSAAILHAAGRGDFMLSSVLRPGIGQSVDKVFQRAFAQRACDRYYTAIAFASAFAKAMGAFSTRIVPLLGQPIGTVPISAELVITRVHSEGSKPRAIASSGFSVTLRSTLALRGRPRRS